MAFELPSQGCVKLEMSRSDYLYLVRGGQGLLQITLEWHAFYKAREPCHFWSAWGYGINATRVPTSPYPRKPLAWVLTGQSKESTGEGAQSQQLGNRVCPVLSLTSESPWPVGKPLWPLIFP